MKKSILVALILIASPAMAIDPATKKFCASQESLAKSMMQYRQSGGSMSKAIAINDKQRKKNPKLAKFYDASDSMTQAAFARPRYSSKKYQQNAVINFGNDMYKACLKGVKK